MRPYSVNNLFNPREMELRRRKKEEEKLSTERKIKEVQVKVMISDWT